MNGEEAGAAKTPGLDEKDFSTLLQSISAMAPLMQGMFGGGNEKKTVDGAKKSESDQKNRRETLLIAIKPYLTDDRQAAVDYLIRIGRLGDLLRRWSGP